MDNGNEKLNENLPQISKGWRIFFVGMPWFFWLSSICSYLFYSWSGAIVLLFVGQLFYRYTAKYKLSLLPRWFTVWFRATRFYGIFVRRVIANRKVLGLYVVFGITSLFLGLVSLAIVLTDPVLDLNQMKIVHGTYEGYQKLRRGGRGSCGDLLLKFRTENGTLVQFWAEQSYWSQSELEKLEQQTKDEILTIWGLPNTIHINPECRKFPSERQIQGKEYQSLYHKEYHEKSHRIFSIIAVSCLIGAGLCLARILCFGGAK